MSMLSEQCDKLRNLAEQVEWELPEASKALRDAADTIWELRDRLTHWELHECPGCKNVADLQEALDENARLRELVRKVERYERMGCHECPMSEGCEASTLYSEECAMSREIEREKRELGVEE